MRVLLARAALAASLVAPLACSGGGDGGSGGLVDPPPLSGPSASPGTVDTIRVSGTSFQPSSLTVRPGRTVVWVNADAMLHTVTPDGHAQWPSASRGTTGEMLRVTFSATGSFPYYCEPHRGSGMTGRITVQP